MIDDPIVAEVRKAREEIFAEAGYDLNRLLERLRRAQEAHPERIVDLTPQRPGKHKRKSSRSARPPREKLDPASSR